MADVPAVSPAQPWWRNSCTNSYHLHLSAEVFFWFWQIQSYLVYVCSGHFCKNRFVRKILTYSSGAFQQLLFPYHTERQACSFQSEWILKPIYILLTIIPKLMGDEPKWVLECSGWWHPRGLGGHICLQLGDTLGNTGTGKGEILCNLPPKNHPLALIMADMNIYLNCKANLTWLRNK